MATSFRGRRCSSGCSAAGRTGRCKPGRLSQERRSHWAPVRCLSRRALEGARSASGSVEEGGAGLPSSDRESRSKVEMKFFFLPRCTDFVRTFELLGAFDAHRTEEGHRDSSAVGRSRQRLHLLPVHWGNTPAEPADAGGERQPSRFSRTSRGEHSHRKCS